MEGARATLPSNGQGPAPAPRASAPATHGSSTVSPASQPVQPAQSIAAKIESPHTGLPTKSSVSASALLPLPHPTRLASHSTLSVNPSNATTA